ncbi:toprim domain-containing protein [Larkinella insperata]|uniref:Toprim domain-containing protein n=1 Tax=Larkinella insperata TaxID=332158 RepID=A0ABW3QGP1_9BACT
MSTKFEELKTRFPNLIPVQELRANISIIELAIQYGYEPQAQKGLSRPVLHHPTLKDTIIVKNPQDPAQQVYQRAGDFSDSGTIVDFVRNRLNSVFSTFNRPAQHEFRNVTDVLYDYLKIDPNQVARNRQAVEAKPDPNPRQTFAKDTLDLRLLEPENYLHKRGIDQKIIESPEFAGKALTQVSYLNKDTGHTEDPITAKANQAGRYLEFHNVAFPYYNGQSAEVMGFEIRNENLKMHAAGSDRYASVFISNVPPKPQHFVVTESVLDAMAHKQLRAIRGDDAFDTVYFSTGGQLTSEQTNTISRYISTLDKSPDWKITLAFDNDTKGHQYDLQFIQQLAASQLPISPIVAGLGRIGYVLPESGNYETHRNVIIDRLRLYNDNLRAQFSPLANDPAAVKELSSQLINVAYKEGQISIHIPQSTPALQAVNEILLDVAGVRQRIGIDKSYSKDFCDDLKRHCDKALRTPYAILDQNGTMLYESKSAATIQRIMKHLEYQHNGPNDTVTFKAIERQSTGFYKPQSQMSIKEGQTVSFMEQPDFKKKVMEEKNELSPPKSRNVEDKTEGLTTTPKKLRP